MSTMITREPTRNDIAHCQGPPQAAEGACCDLARPRRGSAQRAVHEERFAARNTFRREFGLLLPCVAAGSLLAGNDKFSSKEPLRAVTLSFRAQMHELHRLRLARLAARPWLIVRGRLILPTSYTSQPYRQASPIKIGALAARTGPRTGPQKINFSRAVVGPGTPTPSRDASQAPGASKGREPARPAILRRSHYSQTRR